MSDYAADVAKAAISFVMAWIIYYCLLGPMVVQLGQRPCYGC